MLAKAKKLVHTFTQTHTTYAPYANQSGEIFGILTQLLEEMTGDLKALEERDAKSRSRAPCGVRPVRSCCVSQCDVPPPKINSAERRTRV